VIEEAQVVFHKLTSQILSLPSLMLTFWPAKTVLRLILRRPMQMRPHWVTVMVRNHHRNDKRAERPVATESRCLTRPTDFSTLRLACLKGFFAGLMKEEPQAWETRLAAW
jgi:hypothetical protein